MNDNFVRFFSPNVLQKESLIYSDGMGYESNPHFYIDRMSFHNYLVMYTISGELLCHQNGKKFMVHPGESILLDLHLPHRYYFQEGVPTRIAWAHINGTPASHIIQRIQKNLSLPLKINLPEIYDCLLSLFQISDQPIQDVFEHSKVCYAILLVFLKEVWNNSEGNAEDIKYNDFKKTTWQVISHNLHRNITLDELANSVSLSKYHFERMFHRAFGTSPMRFITEERIRQAKYRLLNTTEPVYQISDSLGFTTPSYFSKVFKQITGVSPSEFRENN